MPSTGCVTGIALILIAHLRMTTSQNSTIAPTSNSSIYNSTSPPLSSFNTSTANMTVNVTAIGNMTTRAPSSTSTGSTNATATTIIRKPSNDSTGKISCRTFTCNLSTCYATYLNTTASPCSADAPFCELQRLDSGTFSVNCSAFCNATKRCANSTMTGCSVNCCNSTDCLNSTVASLMTATTVTPVTTVTPQNTASTLTTTRNGKECYTLKCFGEKCYSNSEKKTASCTVDQDFCKLNKTISGTSVSWEAGCSGNCTGDKSCGSTAGSCTQECCNATTSGTCLKLDGSVNMPNSAVVLHAALSLFSPWLLIWALGLCFLIG